MAQVEEDVWDSNHQLREDFSFTGVSTPGIREIILLHDWYAANGPGLSYADMGFADDVQFMAFRQRCASIARNLRRNQYA